MKLTLTPDALAMLLDLRAQAENDRANGKLVRLSGLSREELDKALFGDDLPVDRGPDHD